MDAAEMPMYRRLVFCVFSANPPILIFHPHADVRDNSIKHTLVCRNDWGSALMLANLTWCNNFSGQYRICRWVDEFVKIRLISVTSEVLKPFRVKNLSIYNLNAKVNQIIPLGTEGGTGNLVLAASNI
jgi:hypothetical protein